MTQLKFPDGFLWGASTSAHQVEGGNHNDWSEWEKKNAERLAQEARTKYAPWQQEKFPEMFEPANYISGAAADHYNRYEADFDIAKSLGHTAHRFSIEWSRVEPEEGKWDEKEIEHYRDVVRALRARGIEPFVNLWHWSNPLWIRDIGDWSNKKTVDYYARYVEKVVKALNQVTFWIPINEPNIHTTFAYIKGTQPPGKKNVLKGLRAFRNILIGHKRAYKIIHQYNNGAQVGVASSVMYFESKNNLFINRILTRVYDYFWNLYIFKNTRKYTDFIGLNYYTRALVGFGSSDKSKGSTFGDLGWEIFPKGIYFLLKSLSRFNLPAYISESGLPDADDTKRGKFIKDHLFWVHKAIEEGINVKGYLHWSLLDNNEFVELRGFWPRFGLVEVDFKTQKRTIRPSAYEYAKICKNNALGVTD